MSTTSAFDYVRFLTLTGSDLVTYMEPLVNDSATRVPQDILKVMLSDLPTYDEYHLVYALELGAANSPKSFCPIYDAIPCTCKCFGMQHLHFVF